MDFSTVYTYGKIGENSSSNSTTSTNAIQDFILMFEWIDEHGDRCRQYLDFMCDQRRTNTNDYFYVLEVWYYLFRHCGLKESFDSIELWSDGGPHHFKTRYCQWMWHHLSSLFFDRKPIEHHFFASYHGHSLCDAHAAQVKGCIKGDYICSDQQRMEVKLDRNWKPYWGVSSAPEIQVILNKAISNTTAITLTDIDRDPELKPKVAPIVNIKEKHKFVYQQNQCTMYDLSNSENPTFFQFRYH